MFVIITTGLNGTKTELCRVERNAEQITEAAHICTIGAARGPHAGELTCAGCGQHRGWLSKSTAQWIERVVTRFGAPTTPIVVRKSHTYEEEVPPAETTLHPEHEHETQLKFSARRR